MEKKDLRVHLEAFTYEDFQTLHKDWLKQGRSVWYISGNISAEGAINLVEKTRAQLKLESMSIEDITDSRIIALD